MKKKLILAVFVLAYAANSVAVAVPQSASEVTIQAEPPPICTLSAPTETFVEDAALQLPSTPTASTVVFDAVDDDAMLGSASILLTFSAMCNYASAFFGLQTTNGHMVRSPPASVTGFLTAIDYTASVTWSGPPTRTLIANGTPLATTTAATKANPTNGDLTVNIEVSSSSTPLLAGSYSDILVLRIGTSF